MNINLISAALIFTGVLFYALWQPKKAILLPLIFSSAYLVRIQILGIPTTLLEIILLGVLLGAILSGNIRVKPLKGLTLITVTMLPVILFIIAAAISTTISPHLHTSLGILKAMVVEPIIYAFVLTVIVEKKERGALIFAALTTGGLIAGLLSLASLRFGADFGRFRGIYDVPNSLALIMAPLCTMTILGRLSGTLIKKRHGLLAGLFCFLLLMTQSLAGVGAVATVVFICLILRYKSYNRAAAAVAVMVFLALGLQFYSGKLPHLVNRQSSSLIAREQIWTVAGALVSNHPFLGTGLGTFEPAYQNELRQILSKEKHPAPFSCTLNPVPCTLEWLVRDPHNFLLSFWLNTGLLGLCAMLGLLFLAGKEFLIVAKQFGQPGWQGSPHTFLLKAGLLTLVIFGLFDVSYWKNDLALIWWTLLL